MVEGRGLLKLLPANLIHSFSAHYLAQNPAKENNFTSFCFNNTHQPIEKIVFQALSITSGKKIFNETWKTVVVSRLHVW